MRFPRKTRRPIKVLLVESLDSESVRKRHEILLASPRMAGYRIFWFYPFTDSRLPISLAKESINQKDLTRRLRDAIQEIDPHFVMLHTGFAFRENPEAFYAAFKDLRKEFPAVRFGSEVMALLAERREAFPTRHFDPDKMMGFVVDEEAFDSDPQTLEIQGLLF